LEEVVADKELFTWIPFYEEFADILLEYRNCQGELIECLEDLKGKGLSPTIPIPSSIAHIEFMEQLKGKMEQLKSKGLTITPLQDRNSEGEKSLLTEIDPFTFYGVFNRRIKTEDRVAIIGAVKERFDVKADVPSDFTSIPILHTMKSWFFPFAPKREKGHIEKLWRSYELALGKDPLNDDKFADAFNEAIRLRQVRFNLTMGLFWIRPNVFLNLDGPVRRYLRHRYPGIPWKTLWGGFNFEKYKETCDKVRENERRPFYEISHEAFCYNKEQKEAKAPANLVADASEPDEEKAVDIPLNTILYGPPGTGKTYRTINEAVEILDCDFYSENGEDREKIQDRFEELKEVERRVDFVTFHQSFSYEEFIEGLNAVTEDGKVFYKVEDGLFKKLCARAQGGRRGLSFEQYIEKLKEECSENAVEMQTVRGNPIQVTYRGGITFRVSPERKTEDPKADYPVSIDSIIKTYLGADFREFHNPSYIRAVINYIEEKYKPAELPGEESEPYLLIIDEINRGNISAIFGELITLLEPSKRADADDELSVVLPYSQEYFSVPANLYIIGTMNTADRSIALLDTALRRRFRFVEMMPDYELLKDVKVGDIEIPRLLETINQRIEALYDRDHQIGHTYFLPLKDEPTLGKLSDIFRHSILPLLQEYFYDNWEKINLALNNNGFVTAKESPSMPDSELIDPEKKIWRISEESVFRDPEKYKSIYDKQNANG